LKVKVSNLHPNITDEMLAAIFEPFGRVIKKLEYMYAFVTNIFDL
jgi:hypothetical protein